MTNNPVIVLGAPRSGTNMLRDVLTSLDGMESWPCDEINHVWRYGNALFPSDELPANLAREHVKQYIRKQFDWVRRRYEASTVVEKTCANSLRVPFVNAVLPEARYILIYRNGFDAVSSALKRWSAPIDIPYLARKARFVPLLDVPFYLFNTLKQIKSAVGNDQTTPRMWGPKIQGFETLLSTRRLDEVAAMQWQRCNERALADVESMHSEKWTTVSYERFVSRPEEELNRLLEFLNLEVNDKQRTNATNSVYKTSIGRGQNKFDEEARKQLNTIMGSTLESLEYQERATEAQ